MLQDVISLTMLSVTDVRRYAKIYSHHEMHTLTLVSTSLAFVTSAWTAQIGTTAQHAFQMLTSSIQTTDLYQSMNPFSMLLQLLVAIRPKLVTTASTAMDHSATPTALHNQSFKETDLSVLFATTSISVPTVRRARSTTTTRRILSSSSRPRCAMSA